MNRSLLPGSSFGSRGMDEMNRVGHGGDRWNWKQLYTVDLSTFEVLDLMLWYGLGFRV